MSTMLFSLCQLGLSFLALSSVTPPLAEILPCSALLSAEDVEDAGEPSSRDRSHIEGTLKLKEDKPADDYSGSSMNKCLLGGQAGRIKKVSQKDPSPFPDPTIPFPSIQICTQTHTHTRAFLSYRHGGRLGKEMLKTCGNFTPKISQVYLHCF